MLIFRSQAPFQLNIKKEALGHDVLQSLHDLIIIHSHGVSHSLEAPHELLVRQGGVPQKQVGGLTQALVACLTRLGRSLSRVKKLL